MSNSNVNQSYAR